MLKRDGRVELRVVSSWVELSVEWGKGAFDNVC